MKSIIASLFALFAAAALSGGERVVSIAPSLTETVYAVGGESILVGRSDACDYPAEALALPVAGDYTGVFWESALKLRPTVILCDSLKNPADEKMAGQLGIEILCLPSRRLQDYKENISRLIPLLDAPAARRAASEAERFNARLDEIRSAVPPSTPPTVLALAGTSPLVAAGSGTLIDDAIRCAGGRNIIDGRDGYFLCSWEWILAHKPQFILVLSAEPQSVEALRRLPLWEELDASGAVVISDIDPDLLCRLSPRTLEGVELLRQHLRAEHE